MPPRLAGGILFTKVTVPPASTLAAGGVTFLISIVADGAALAAGASRTAATAAHSQPRTAAASPRRAFRRIRPVAMLSIPPYISADAPPYSGVTPVTLQERRCDAGDTGKPQIGSELVSARWAPTRSVYTSAPV